MPATAIFLLRRVRDLKIDRMFPLQQGNPIFLEMSLNLNDFSQNAMFKADFSQKKKACRQTRPYTP
jgi:hypothetical protein